MTVQPSTYRNSPTTGEMRLSAAGWECYTGSMWVPFDHYGADLVPLQGPTPWELEQHPTLKQAWEEYLIVRQLLRL